jgi:hypothetical protein
MVHKEIIAPPENGVKRFLPRRNRQNRPYFSERFDGGPVRGIRIRGEGASICCLPG